MGRQKKIKAMRDMYSGPRGAIYEETDGQVRDRRELETR